MHKLFAALGLFIIVCSACSKPGDGKKAAPYNVAQFQGLWVDEEDVGTIQGRRTLSKKLCDKAMDLGERGWVVTEINSSGEVFQFDTAKNSRSEDQIARIRNGKLTSKEVSESQSLASVRMVNGNLEMTIQAGKEPQVFKFVRISEGEARELLAAEDVCIANAPPPPARLTQHEVGTGQMKMIGGENLKMDFSPATQAEIYCSSMSHTVGKEADTYSSFGVNIKKDANTNSSVASLALPTSVNASKSTTEFSNSVKFDQKPRADFSFPGRPELYFTGGNCKATLSRSRKILDVVLECSGMEQWRNGREETKVSIISSFACDASNFLN